LKIGSAEQRKPASPSPSLWFRGLRILLGGRISQPPRTYQTLKKAEEELKQLRSENKLLRRLLRT